MDFVSAIPNFIVNEILAVPAFLIGIITAVGLIALRKSAGQVLGGAIKATLGFLLLGAGAGIVVSSLEPLGSMITFATGTKGVIPTNEAIAAIAQESYGSQVAWLMILGFAVSLLLARFTPLRYVFLTGHHVLFMATMLTIILAASGFNSVVVVLLGAVLLGILMVSLPALAHPYTRKITGDDSIAIGHFGTAGYLAAGAVGQAVGGRGKKQSPSTEKSNLPQGLSFLRDSMVSTALSMAIMYVAIAVLALIRVGSEEAFAVFETEPANTGAYIMASVNQGFQFGIGVAVILFGVRTILGELVPAFQGIAARVVPGAIPALDCPIVFPYAQNAVIIGFISSFVGGLVGLAVLSAWLNPVFGLALILPGLVPHFFTGGAAGVYGNATGGRRGAIFGAFTNGLIITFGPALLMGVLGEFADADTTFGDADFGWFGILVGKTANLGGLIALVLLILIGAILLAGAIFVQKRFVDRPCDPAPWRGSYLSGGDAKPELSSSNSETVGVIKGYSKIAPPPGAPMPPQPEVLGFSKQ
ncbi:PTS ascorbate transporter subunit IIC [Corynebacterium pelargi]|uniref:Ascorbate-specific PTS system EIIC component n=1 Tax=Corynebacterium pelargi TaxID=1471400 RepID=A0A410W873_9CORY|nr:PTS ascorbate transporter subunit IIC [Corynebacterium pelargi]QAU52153.1 Ascorbate-specific permease IIC component UlaA [Corynebacterium pelargi]GGG69779.1 PTS ascorbate transporter subunit IIC [Corynebacterium pelargi]